MYLSFCKKHVIKKSEKIELISLLLLKFSPYLPLLVTHLFLPQMYLI